MSKIYWQAKIWGLLHDPALKGLHHNRGRGQEGQWESLACMEGWASPKNNEQKKAASWSRQWLEYIGLCDLIASASDRATIGRLPNTSINYDENGLEIKHLLSGKTQTLKLEQWHNNLINLIDSDRTNWLNGVENAILDPIKTWTDPRKVYWWLWRCYPEALSNALDSEGKGNEPLLALLPAETRLPDASVWSHTTMTSALAGALAGYHKNPQDYPIKGQRGIKKSRPHIATFSFSPVQELIKASRKMRDFWAGSWLLHYLSAKVCWDLAWQYGPDVFLYPCLYQQPLIDLWLLEQYPDFEPWIKTPQERSLLTAGFPNVIVCILPDNGTPDEQNPVKAAMQSAESSLKDTWNNLGEKVLQDLQGKQEDWIKNLNGHSWDSWLKSQWQTYWVSVPLGHPNTKLDQSPMQRKGKKSPNWETRPEYQEWQKQQNQYSQPKNTLLVDSEFAFVEAAYHTTLEDFKKANPDVKPFFDKRPNLNVGSWWATLFDLTRYSLSAVKNARNWQLPTAFGPRSTISGVGPVVHSGPDWVTEKATKSTWERQMGRFDGSEQLNATEVLKRSLNRVLSDLLPRTWRKNERHALYYPDLSSGVAGWLHQHPENIPHYQEVCTKISKACPWTEKKQEDGLTSKDQPWGIPWIAENHPNLPNPRLLNAGWLIEDYTSQSDTEEQRKKDKQEELKHLRQTIQKDFPPGQNPTDWYIIAAGDGDGMGDWLKGTHLDNYADYIPEALKPKIEQLPDPLKTPFQKFLKEKKRMGPATHSALSRALLDFSNQLLPYLTETRYAGRLIYGGGDDVLAYTNLWEWDSWLWDVRQCFKGGKDPKDEFDNKNKGDYWKPKTPKENIADRPLFTMGEKATISFGVVMAHHSVPLAIALENLWEAENEAKDHKYENKEGKECKKDAVQVRVIYGNGNILKATTKFNTFAQWRELLKPELEPALFESAAQLWEQHPVPEYAAINPWVQAFVSRREVFKENDKKQDFINTLKAFLQEIWSTTSEKDQEKEVKNWFKLAAFALRNSQVGQKQGASIAPLHTH